MADAVLVDANLLIWAHHGSFPDHQRARAWWSATVNDSPLVGIAWPTALAFLRISTHPRVFEQPLGIAAAWAIVEGWHEQPNVQWFVPSERHQSIFGQLVVAARATANHTSDAHLAALAIEWGLELASADADFARYPGLRWTNPLP